MRGCIKGSAKMEISSCSPIFASCHAKLKELYDLHDHYYTETPSEKQAMLMGLIEEIDTLVDEMIRDSKDAETNESKAEVAFICWRAWNAMETYQAAAEENLSKAVKLDPANALAWWELGLCF